MSPSWMDGMWTPYPGIVAHRMFLMECCEPDQLFGRCNLPAYYGTMRAISTVGVLMMLMNKNTQRLWKDEAATSVRKPERCSCMHSPAGPPL